ncbi:amphi-Trp domain-containing protein [Thermodesulfobacteriota bacterium]
MARYVDFRILQKKTPFKKNFDPFQQLNLRGKNMGIETVLFKSEERKSANEIAEILRQIADKIEIGSMTLMQSGNETILDFPQSMILEMKVEEEQGRKLKKSFEIELEWIPGENQEGGATILK